MTRSRTSYGAFFLGFLVLLLFLQGCGGGGGSAPSGSAGTSPTPGTGTPSQSTAIVAEVEGEIGVPQTTNQSLLKSQSRVSRAVSTVSLGRQNKAPLSGVSVELWAVRTEAGIGEVEYLQLGSATTDTAGKYNLKILNSAESRLLSLSKTDYVTSVAALYTSTHRVKLKLKRPLSTPPINKSLSFRPSVNQKILGDAVSSVDLRIDASLDLAQDQNLKLEIQNKKELEEWNELLSEYRTNFSTNPSGFDWNPNEWEAKDLSERIVVQEQVDSNSNGLADETEPLVVFDKPQIVNKQPTVRKKNPSDPFGKIVRIFEVDADGNSSFGEGSDLVSAQIFGADSARGQVSSFVDLFSEGEVLSEEIVSTLDTTPPVLEFLNPIPRTPPSEASGDLEIRLRFSDETAFDLSSLKVWANEKIEFLKPVRFTLASGSDFAQEFFTKERDSSTGSGLASFLLQNVIFALGPRTHTLFASIQDFAGNQTQAEVTFVVNAAPEFASNTPRVFTVSEGTQVTTTRIQIFDVDRIDVQLISLSGSLSSNIFLTTSTDTQAIQTDRLFKLNPNSSGSSNLVTFYLNVQSNEDLALGGNKVLQIRATDYPKNDSGVEERGTDVPFSLTLEVKTRNNPPEIRAICWTNELRPDNPFRLEPQDVCTALGTTEESRHCRTPASEATPLVIDENKLADFTICGFELDSEDALTFQYMGITKTGAGEDQETTSTPDFTSEFFFTEPSSVEYAFDSTSVFISSPQKESTIGAFQWKPFGNEFRDQNTLVFRASDEKGIEGVRTCLADLSDPEGIIGFYGFEEAAGSLVADQINGNDGFLSGGVLRVPGTIEQALFFDGVDDQLETIRTRDLNVSESFTIELWVRPQSFPASGLKTGTLLINEDQTLFLKTSPSGNSYEISFGVSTDQQNGIIRGGTLQPLKWHHLSITYDSSLLRIYIDGTEAASTALSGQVNSSFNRLRFGSDSIEHFRGKVDDIKIYNTAVSGSNQILLSSCVSSVEQSIILSVATVEDAPFIESVNTLGLVTGEFPGTTVYADRPFLVQQRNNPQFFEPYRIGSDTILFKAQQGEPIEITFEGNDDENRFSPGNIDGNNSAIPLLILTASPGWLNQSVQPLLGKTNYALILEGTPTSEDAGLIQTIDILTDDPGNKARQENLYRFQLEVLDQNDQPWYLNSSQAALSQTPPSLAPEPRVTLTLDAIEDQKLTFWIHAFDIDPVPPQKPKTSPYWNPELFSFDYNAPALARLRTQPEPISLEPHIPGTSYRSAKVEWTPRSADTGEDLPAGVGAIKQNQIIVQTRATCPSLSLLIDSCLNQTNEIDIRVNVLSVDEAPKFRSLFLDNLPVLEETGETHSTRIVNLNEGIRVELKQAIKDEENQSITDIVIKKEDTSLSSFKSNFTLVNVARGGAIGIGSQESFVVMTGSPQVRDYIDVSNPAQRICSLPLWVEINSESQCRPPIVSMTIEAINSIAATGATTASTKVLRIRVDDIADPLFFVDPLTHDPAVRFSNSTTNVKFNADVNLSAQEDELFTLELAAYNDRDKNPEFWDGFQFFLIQSPEPPGNISINSNSFATTNTTAVLSWTPTQIHAEGTEDKVHDIIIRACIRDPQALDPNLVLNSSCRDQRFKINVNAVPDNPVIFFGDELRNLSESPITPNNPFLIFEDTRFERLIRVEDEDLQGVNLQASFALAALTGSLDVAARSTGAGLLATNEIIFPENFEPIDGDEGTNFVQTIISWASIDFDDIYTTSIGSHPRVATYVLHLEANTRGISDASGKTSTDVYLEVRSVNDVPTFTTGIIGPILQTDGQDTFTTSVDLLDIVANEENDPLNFTLIDKGTASAFLADLSAFETGIRTHVLHLTSSPGENGVADHTLVIKVEERNNPDNSSIAELILQVTDSNDPPKFEDNPLFGTTFTLVEGTSKLDTLDVLDADLLSAEALELVTFEVIGSFQSDFTSSTLLYSNGENFATTSNLSFFGTTIPAPLNSPRALFQFNFFPRKLSGNPFSATTYYLQFTATDRFRKDDLDSCETLGINTTPCPGTDIVTVAFQILPVDNRPSFSSVNTRPIETFGVIPICVTTPTCFDDDFFITQKDPGSQDAFLFSVIAEDQETEPLSFSFSSPLGASILTASIDNLVFLSDPFSSSPSHPTSPDSILLSFTPTNGNVGLQTFGLKVSDPGVGSGASVNSTRSATREFSILVQNSADAPVLKELIHNSTNILGSASPIVFYEDRIEEILISIDDLDLHLPDQFSERELAILSSSYGLNTTQALLLEQRLFPQEFFSYQLMNLTSYSNLKILTGSQNEVNLFQFASPANLVQTTTTNFATLRWTPEDRFTFPKFSTSEFGATNGEIIWKFRTRSFASNSTAGIRPTSVETFIRIRVVPVNDAPRIRNTEIEALATQDQPFSFTVQGIDEEENSLLYFFETKACNPDSVPPIVPPTCNPGDMDFDGADIQWNPTNQDTQQPFYDVVVFARDTGKVSDISISGLPPTTPLSSETYTLRIFLNDLDDPAIRDGSVNPLTITTEDELYITSLKYDDPDFSDVLNFSFQLSPVGMTIEDDDRDGEATIRWIPELPGTYPVNVEIQSSKNSALRSSLFFDFNLEVTPVNDPPVFNSLPLSTMKENSPYLYNIDISDEDDASIFLSLIKQDIPDLNLLCDPNPEQFVELFASDRKLQGSTNLSGFETRESSLEQEGLVTSINICIQATDGQGYSTQAFTLIVQADNNPPTIQEMKITSSPTGAGQPVPTQSSLSQADLLVSAEPLVYKDPSLRKVKLYQGVPNTITMLFSDEELDYPFTFQEFEGPGVTLSQTSAADLSHVTLTLSWSPQTNHISNPPIIKLRATDNRSKPTDLILKTEIIDTPDKPTFTFNKKIQFIDEDLSQSISLGGADADLSSVLSYSIVPHDSTTAHPVKPIFRDNPYDLPTLLLEINNQGSVTFLSKVSNPAIIQSAPTQVPVTFSICGTARVTGSGFESDCETATFHYQILSRDDQPFFSPSIPSTVKTTAKEGDSAQSSKLGYSGGLSPGLTFRKVRSSDPCPTETSQEICVVDEESSNSDDLFGVKEKVLLLLTVPAIPPDGLVLTDPQESCYVASSGMTCPLSQSQSFACQITPAGCSSARYTVVQTLSWDSIPFDQPSVRNIEITARQSSDSTKQGTFTFSLEIENTNRSPVINNNASLVPEQINESTTFTYSLAQRSSDPDSDTLLYELVQGVSQMAINTNSGLLTWTPNASHIGEHLIQFRVTDKPASGTPLSTSANLEITVLKKNNPPILEKNLRKVNNITVARSPIATEDQLFEAKVFARDEEGDAFSFIPNDSTLNGLPLPDGFDLTSFGRIAWTPPNSSVGPNTLLVVVKDTFGFSSSREYDITVKNQNDPPVITNPVAASPNVFEQALFTYNYITTDQDASDTLTYSVAVTPVLSATISPLGALLIQPQADDAGTYIVEVTARDGGGLTDTNSFTLEVLEKNNPPTLESIPDPLFISRSTIFNYQLFANDPEQDTLTFFFEAKPTNVDLDQDSGLLTITPLGNENTQEFKVFCKDSQGQESSRRVVKLQFTDTSPPLITSIPAKVGKILTPYTYTVQSDAPEFVVQLLQGPSGMVVPVGSKTIQWTPAFSPPDIDQSGVYTVVLRITTIINDETIQSAPQRYLLTISKENDAPTLELAKDVNGISIDTYDASQGIPFLKTVMTVKDQNIEDLSRLDFYFHDNNKSKLGTSTPLSASLAQLLEVSGTRIINNGIAQVGIELSWSADNGAAFAVANGDINEFTVVASDGITESQSLAIRFNVTNRNDLPVFYDDENQGTSEIAFVGETYRREFFGRDLDNQITYFCFDNSKFFIPNQVQALPIYPSQSPIVAGQDGFELSGLQILDFQGDGGYLFTAGTVPANMVCKKGVAVTGINDPHPERGKLSKISVVWDTTSFSFGGGSNEELPLILWDNNLIDSFNSAPTFTLKLAPVISNLLPNIQYIGDEVAISGKGIIKSEDQLNVQFLRSDGTISAVTEVFGLTDFNPGQGRFIVPEGATSGFVSVGYTNFSSPVPFTVLDGKTSVIAGSAQVDQDLLSIPSGMAVTYISPTSAVFFVSNMEYHTIHSYLRDENTSQTTALGILSGQLGTSGDLDGDRNTALYHSPTGLSLARRDGKEWLLVADTENHKIKAVDLSELATLLTDSPGSFPAYTIASSTHLNRPYKAIQHSDPTSSDFFFIANTFNNSIEMLYAGESDFSTLPTREPTNLSGLYSVSLNPYTSAISYTPNFGNANVKGSKNTYTVAGTGFARVDAFGNLFHPVDLVMKEEATGYKLIVSSYSNYKYSFNNSWKLDLYTGADRNNVDTNNTGFYQSGFYLNAMNLGDYGAEVDPSEQIDYDGEILMIAQANTDNYQFQNGLDVVTPSEFIGQTDKAHFLITGADAFYQLPSNVASLVESDVRQTNLGQVDNQRSLEKILYQTYELEIPSTVNEVGIIQNKNPGLENNKAAVLIQPGTREVTITPLNEDGTYNISNLTLTSLPEEIGNASLGTPLYYDTNQDYIADLWLPIPTLSSVYVFPGRTAAPPSPPLTFDTENYWIIENSSFGADCVNNDCLSGVTQVAMGRVLPFYAAEPNNQGFVGVDPTQADENINESIAIGEDLILVGGADAKIKIVDSYGWTRAAATVTGTDISSYNDRRFHINHTNSPSGDLNTDFTQPVGSTSVDFTRNPTDSDNAYNFIYLKPEGTPEEICVAHYWVPLRQSCVQGNATGNVCPKSTSEGATPQLTDIDLNWKLEASTTPTFSSVKEYILNAEQIAVRFAPQAGTNQSSIGLLGAEPDTQNFELKSLFTDRTISKLHCGEPFARPDRTLTLRLLNEDNLARQDINPAFDFGKPDSLMFVDATLKFKVFDVSQTDFGNTFSASNYAGADTTLKDGNGNTFSSADDFLLYDFSGDGVADLVTLHATDQSISIRLGTGNNSGRLFAEDDPTEIQVLDTLAGASSIDLIKTTTDSRSYVMDLLVTNSSANSVSIYQRIPQDNITQFFRSGVHLNVGDTGNIASKSVIVTDTIFTGFETQNSPTAIGTNAYEVWDDYYYGSLGGSFTFYHTGMRHTQRTTSGMVSIQSSPLKTFSSLGSFLTTEGVIFNTSRSTQATDFPSAFETAFINDDLIPDLIIMDSQNLQFSVFLSDNGRSITYIPDRVDYDLFGIGGGMAIGDLNEAFDFASTPTQRPDIVISNYDQDSITVYFNGGVPFTNANSQFSYNHSGFPPVVISVGRGPRGVTIADLDLDGHNDIAVANEISNNLAIIYHKGDTAETFTYHNPLYYSVGFSPSSVRAMKTRTNSSASGGVHDLLVMSEDLEDVAVLLNKASQGKRGFEKPRSIPLAEHFISLRRLVDTQTEQELDPFQEIPRYLESGDFGNMTAYTAATIESYFNSGNFPVSLADRQTFYSENQAELLTETVRYDNLLIGQKRMIYTLKNIGNKEYSAYRSAISSFTVNSDGVLHLDSLKTFEDGVVKSIFTTESNLYINRTELNDNVWQGNTGTDGTVYRTSVIHRISPAPSLRSAPITTITTGIPPADSALDIRFSQFGAGLEAMVQTSNPFTGSHHIFALHSGRDKGILEVKDLDSATPTFNYLLNTKRENPVLSGPQTKFGTEVSLFQPGGMTLDPNLLSLLLIDRGNQYLRVIDLEDNITRTLSLRDSPNPILENIVDITNVKNTFNYYVITNDRKLYLINPSNSPISVTTQVFSFDFSQHSSFDWFKIESKDDFLYIGARDTNSPPTSGKIYQIDRSASPLDVTEITLAGSQTFGGLGGFTVDSSTDTLYYTEQNQLLIKSLNLSAASLAPETIAGIQGLKGHLDGAVSIALINSPGDLALNQAKDKLYFIDGSSIRALNLFPSEVTGDLEISTISGDPDRTGILNGDGQRARFIKPAYLFYQFKDGKDVLYLSDEMAHNVRKVEINP